MGFLHKPNIPKFPGLSDYKGRIFHSTEWDSNFDYNSKRVAVIGSGPTAIQLIPQIAKVSNVTMFQRSPMGTAPVFPKILDYSVSPVITWIWRLCPFIYDLVRYSYISAS